MNESFGAYIRRIREQKNLPLRKVAAHLDIDTSTLSKVERSERPASPDYLQPLSEILCIDLKEIQTMYIADRINRDFGHLEHLSEGLKEAENQINKNKK